MKEIPYIGKIETMCPNRERTCGRVKIVGYDNQNHEVVGSVTYISPMGYFEKTDNFVAIPRFYDIRTREPILKEGWTIIPGTHLWDQWGSSAPETRASLEKGINETIQEFLEQ
ncbi:MAG: hypothetical protein JSW08_00130 [archaeon]|nr:MAG: hypothetical protein JSW08_00130 [archaeon]